VPRVLRILGTLGTLATGALGASCILPEATVVSGGGGGTPLGTAMPVVIVLQDDVPAMALSGNATQHHLIYAEDQWWALYPTSQVVNANTSRDFITWAPNQGGGGTKPTLHYDVPPATIDGRIFGADTAIIDGTDVVHVSLSGSEMPGNREEHDRATVVNGTPLSELDFGKGFAMSTSNVYARANGADGTVTTIASNHQIFDFASLGMPVCTCCALESVADDSGASWTSGFEAPEQLDDGNGTAVAIRGAVALPGSVALLWPSGDDLLFSSRPLASPGKWSPSQPMAAQPLGISSERGARDWAECVGSSSRIPTAHLLAAGGAGFQHFESTDGANWTPRASSPKAPGAAVSELFLACGSDQLYAFTIGAATDGYPIQGTLWDAGADQWSDWTTIVSGPPTRAQRCFLSGSDQVAGVGIGLIWTESDDCTQPEPVSLYGALVPP